MRASPLITLGCLACGCASAPARVAGPDEGGPTWREISSAHFAVKTDLPSAEGAEVVQFLERTRTALLASLWPQAASPPGQLDVVLLATEAEYGEFAPPTLGAFVAGIGPYRMMVAAGTVDRLYLYGLVSHELTHWLSAFILQRQPKWLSEGLATYAETMRLSLLDPRVLLGMPHPGRYPVWRSRPVPLADLIRKSSSSHFTAVDPQADAYYASAWMLTHYLINAQRERFVAFQQHLAFGDDPDNAWVQTLGALPAGQLDADLQRYGSSGVTRTYALSVALVAAPVQERILSSAEVHVVRAKLRTVSAAAVAKAPDLRRIRSDLEAALASDPWNADALAMMSGFSGWGAIRPRAVHTTVVHPDDWRSWWLAARATSPASPDGQQAFERYMQKAVDLAPEKPWVLTEMARWRAAQGRLAEAVPLAEQAARLAPWDSDTLDALADVALGSGRCPEARASEKRAIENLSEKLPPAAAAPYLDRLVQIEQRCGTDPELRSDDARGL
jgi:tetratricopeptide (TPR) repeat protein